MFFYAGFLLGTLFCALAPNYLALIMARVITGAFGGILGGMTMAIIGDVFPEHRRGRATGSLMTGFALASVAGVPFGLVVGTNFGWHTPFIALAIAGLPILLLIPFAMSEQQLPLVYVAGGLLTLFAAPLIGRMADRYGKLIVYRLIAPVSATLLVVITHLPAVHVSVAIAVFGALMVSNVGRMVAAMAMVTSCVEPNRRGAFLSANSSVQHVASGFGAYVGGLIVTQSADGRLEHFGTVGWIAAASTLISLWVAGRVRILVQPTVSANESTAEISLPAAAKMTAEATSEV